MNTGRGAADVSCHCVGTREISPRSWSHSWLVCSFARAAGTKHHKLSGLNNSNVLSYGPEIKNGFLLTAVRKDLFQASPLVSGSLLAMFEILRLVQVSPGSLPLSLQSVVYVQISPFYKDNNNNELGATLPQYGLICTNYIC